ncbi:60S ribosomal protein L34 [Sparganum proliferum]|nr:unnamed protein product [Spirometra erinaceieuropaei]
MQRLTLRRRLSYNTNSNRRQKVKTPGGKVVYIYLKKRGTLPKCGDCKRKLDGIKPSRPMDRSRMSKRMKTVNRTYEQKVLKQILREKRKERIRAAIEKRKQQRKEAARSAAKPSAKAK